MRAELAAALEGFTDPATGAHPIRRAVPREQVLDGAYLDRAPDLLLEAAPLYSLTHARQMVEPADWLSGDHRPEGVYVAAGPGAGPANGAEISLTDFAAMILAGGRRRARRRLVGRPGGGGGGGVLRRGAARGRGAPARAGLPRVAALHTAERRWPATA